MRAFKTVRLRLRSLFQSQRVAEDVDAELREHLERLVDNHRAAGLAAGEARDAALREFGNLPLVQEQCRDSRGVNWIEDLSRDLAYALRSMRRAPGFTAVALLSLALGIGANTAIFSLLDAVMLRSLPVAAPEQLVLIDGFHETEMSVISYPMYRDLAARQQVFTDVIASHDYYAAPLRVRIGESSVAQPVRGGAVSGNYFSTLGLVPPRGRLFVPADDEPGDPASVAVVSHDFWQRELGGAPSVVGRPLSINGEPFTVVGVAPAGFTGLSIDSSLDVWVPLTKFRPARDLRNRRGTFFRLMGRLRPGVTAAQAQTAMTLLFQQLRADELQTGVVPAGARVEGHRIVLQPGDRGFAFFRERFAPTLTILMAMAALLVAIVCMNLATLLSARATARQREIAVRQALGASRRRLVQQVLTENVLLAAVGGALGFVFAIWGSRILLGFVSTEIALHSGFNRYVPDGLQFRIDLRMLAFAVGIALLVGLVLALTAARSMNRPDVITLLKQRTANSQGLTLRRSRIPVRKILVASQVAFSVVILAAAGLMVRTVINLRGVDPGFDPANVVLVDLNGIGTGRTGSQLTAFEHSLHERLNALPGVRSASLSWIAPFSDTDWRMRVLVDGHTPAPSTEPTSARIDAVSAGYFETMGMILAAGRTFTTDDNESAPPVALVNEAFVRRFIADASPIGKRFAVGGPGATKEIVGVIRDAKYNDLREGTRAMFYVPLLQRPAAPARSIQVRTTASPQALIQQIRQVVREADPNLVINDSKTLGDQVNRTLARERLLADLSGFFGAAALLLACIGLYSVLAYHVVQRTQEIGVRIALGSSRAAVMWLVARDALRLVGAGVAVGVPAALALSDVIASQLFGVSPTDPATLITIVTILIGVAAVACYLPARRAARVDPVIALASE